MKSRSILIMGIVLVGLSLQTMAQSSLTSRYSKVLDTVTNTGTKVLTSPRVSGVQQTVSVAFNVPTVISGTLAGVVRLYGSLDNVVYTRITASELRSNSINPVDSLLIDVNKKAKTWVVPNSPYQYYQTQITGVGTTVFTTQAKIVAH